MQIVDWFCVSVRSLTSTWNMRISDVGNNDARHALNLIVELRGIEPLASSMPWRRSTN